jgi:hypothetical protein
MFRRVDKSEIKGVIKEFNCIKNCDIIIEIGSVFNIFEFSTGAGPLLLFFVISA